MVCCIVKAFIHEVNKIIFHNSLSLFVRLLVHVNSYSYCIYKYTARYDFNIAT